MEGCIFCMIARGEIPSQRLYEDDTVMAFDDITPQAPVHALVVPKAHYASLDDNVPEELLGHLLAVAAQVASAKGVAESGYRIAINNGPDGGQSVGHLHVHVLGGKKLGESLVGGASA